MQENYIKWNNKNWNVVGGLRDWSGFLEDKDIVSGFLGNDSIVVRDLRGGWNCHWRSGWGLIFRLGILVSDKRAVD